MRVQYETWNPKQSTRDIVDHADTICREYAAQGYSLTLRQLYYRFVAAGLLPNSDLSYNNLGNTIGKARMAGLLDWWHVVDRTRSPRQSPHWDSPADIMRSALHSFALDKWADQKTRVEVWVEKEALAEVIGRVADREDCLWFACRGYVSMSAMWSAARRIGARYEDEGQSTVILHLGDHDPSGIDMTRDIRDRLETFLSNDYGWGCVDNLEVRRIALTMDQIDTYNPPPNPAKLTDSRGSSYVEEYGNLSWELDALEPSVLDALITEHIVGERDADQWDAQVRREAGEKVLLRQASERWADVAAFLRGVT